MPTVKAARDAFRIANGFADYSVTPRRWEWVKMGVFGFPVPNPPARVVALERHDLHHLVTGYQTDWRGEFEIAAWELGAGCGRFWFAWAINLSAVPAAVLMPRRFWRALQRGRRCRPFYAHPDLDAVMHWSVDEAKAWVGTQ